MTQNDKIIKHIAHAPSGNQELTLNLAKNTMLLEEMWYCHAKRTPVYFLDNKYYCM